MGRSSTAPSERSFILSPEEREEEGGGALSAGGEELCGGRLSDLSRKRGSMKLTKRHK